MNYLLIQSNFKCHFESQPPLPFNLLILGSYLEKCGSEVKIIDLYNTNKRMDNLNIFNVNIFDYDKIIINIGEYTADIQYNQLDYIEAPYSDYEYIGSYSWFSGIGKSNPIIFEKEISKKDIGKVEINWDLIYLDDYPTINKRKRAILRLSRGCINKCNMCPVFLIYHGQYIPVDVDWSINEIDNLYERGIREIDIIDDNLFVNIKKGKKLLLNIIEREYTDLFFYSIEGMEVLQALDKELCELLKQANFYHVRLGVETLNEEGLQKINKAYTNPDKAIEAIENLKEVGYSPNCFVISDLPGAIQTIFRLENMGCTIREQKMKNYLKLRKSWEIKKTRKITDFSSN